MDIEIDPELVEPILEQEYPQARREIAAFGPVRAYELSQMRHDERLAAAPDAPTLACKAGCYWCCYFSVDVRAVEVVRILDFVATHFTPEEQARLQQEVQTNSAVFRPLDEMERMRRNVKCPFLAAGRCTIYAARPQTCRNYHATDVAGCQQSFEEPDNFDIEPEFAPLFYQAGGAHVDAFAKALRDEGYEIDAYEINTAIAAALADPQGTRRRFDAKARALPALEGSEVPFEFVDDESGPTSSD
jgi:Fe-S-cluster containining protein